MFPVLFFCIVVSVLVINASLSYCWDLYQTLNNMYYNVQRVIEIYQT